MFEKIFYLGKRKDHLQFKFSFNCCFQDCYTWYVNPNDPITKDYSGQDEQCIWCGQGDEILCCDKCSHSVCCTCIEQNLGEETLSRIRSEGQCIFRATLIVSDNMQCQCCDCHSQNLRHPNSVFVYSRQY